MSGTARALLDTTTMRKRRPRAAGNRSASQFRAATASARWRNDASDGSPFRGTRTATDSNPPVGKRTPLRKAPDAERAMRRRDRERYAGIHASLRMAAASWRVSASPAHQAPGSCPARRGRGASHPDARRSPRPRRPTPPGATPGVIRTPGLPHPGSRIRARSAADFRAPPATTRRRNTPRRHEPQRPVAETPPTLTSAPRVQSAPTDR